MPKPLATLIFIIIEIILLPITIVGLIVFAIGFYSKLGGTNISQTAYDPMFARWFLHVQGKREDKAAKQIWFALPGISRFSFGLAFGPTVWAMRVLGITINMYDYPVHKSRGIFEQFGHRTTFFDGAMLSYLDKAEQVVILGAGWDTRAYGLARREGVRVFEVDAVETQTQKRNSLEIAKIDSSHVIFVTADFNKESWLDTLLRVGFDPGKPTFILWEGVTLYLEAEAVEATLQTVATQLAKGSAIAFDYIGKHFIEDDKSLMMRYSRAKLEKAGESWVFGINTEAPAEEHLIAFLEQNCLKLAEYEPIGKGDEKGRLDGGLVLAVND